MNRANHEEARNRPRARAVSVLLLLLLVVGGLFETEAYAAERRIRFGRGRTSARVEGRLRGMRDEEVFRLRARRGQQMRLSLVRADGPTRTFLVFPNGEEEGQPGAGVIYEGELPVTGDYLIRVRESGMGEAWRGKFLLEVVIN